MPILYSNVTQEPGSEPISLDLAKSHLRVDHNDDDEVIYILIQTAREMVEQRIQRSLITQTRTLKLNYFPRCIDLILPYGPISTDADDIELTYIDENEDEQTLAQSDYWIDSTSKIPKLTVKNSWPSTFDMPNAVTVVYVAGYGTASDVPKPIRSAMLLIIGHLYENKEQVMDARMQEIPFGAETLLNQYTVEHSMIY